VSAHFQSSGPRSNAYSESKFTNWTVYDPFFAEARAALKRFDSKIPEAPAFPYVIVLPPQAEVFMHACTRAEVLWKLERLSPESLEGLRAVFLLAGTRKQERSWRSQLGCYGIYWSRSVFLCAPPFNWRANRDRWREFYLGDVLVHELAHHIDRQRLGNKQAKESFAHAYVQKQEKRSKAPTKSPK
jgi:hypothetical protein